MGTAGPSGNESRSELSTRIEELNREFESGMRARGFEPAQAENIPVPPTLAKLQLERDELIAKLEDMERESGA